MLEKIKLGLKSLWEKRVLIAVVMMLTGTLDLISLGGNGTFGAGWVLGFLLFFAMGIVKIVKK